MNRCGGRLVHTTTYTGTPPVAIARQRAKYRKLKAVRSKLERGMTMEDTFSDRPELMPWLNAVSAQVIARRKLNRMVAR